MAGMIREQGRIFSPIGEARVSVVDVRDIAAVAAAALTERGHEGRTYTITGPEAVTHRQIALAIGASVSRNVAFVDVPPEAFANSRALGGRFGSLSAALNVAHMSSEVYVPSALMTRRLPSIAWEIMCPPPVQGNAATILRQGLPSRSGGRRDTRCVLLHAEPVVEGAATSEAVGRERVAPLPHEAETNAAAIRAQTHGRLEVVPVVVESQEDPVHCLARDGRPAADDMQRFDSNGPGIRVVDLLSPERDVSDLGTGLTW